MGACLSKNAQITAKPIQSVSTAHGAPTNDVKNAADTGQDGRKIGSAASNVDNNSFDNNNYYNSSMKNVNVIDALDFSTAVDERMAEIVNLNLNPTDVLCIQRKLRRILSSSSSNHNSTKGSNHNNSYKGGVIDESSFKRLFENCNKSNEILLQNLFAFGTLFSEVNIHFAASVAKANEDRAAANTTSESV